MLMYVVLAVDRRQVLGCAVSMRSVVESSNVGDAFCFYVLVSGLSVAEREMLARSAAIPGRDVTVHIRPVDTRRFAHLVRSGIVTHTCYARLLIAEVLPPEAERIIYLDCDLIVQRDIGELWRTPLRGCTVGAVANGDRADALSHQTRLALPEPRYFNSGVLLIDFVRWRAKKLGAAALDAASRVGDALILHDQDALNIVLSGDWVEVDPSWNVAARSSALCQELPAIVHFMGSPKPWHSDYSGPLTEKFLGVLSRTPFRSRQQWNPFGLGALFRRLRRVLPYPPGIWRISRMRARTLVSALAGRAGGAANASRRDGG